MRRRVPLWWLLLAGLLWGGGGYLGAWRAQQATDVTNVAMLQEGLRLGDLEWACLGQRPQWHSGWHKDATYIGMLYFQRPKTCAALFDILERLHRDDPQAVSPAGPLSL